MLRGAKSERSADDTDKGLAWSRCTQAFRVRLIANDEFLRAGTHRRRNRIEGLHDTSDGHVACCFCRDTDIGIGSLLAPIRRDRGHQRMRAPDEVIRGDVVAKS
jgi:hypothetical protein